LPSRWTATAPWGEAGALVDLAALAEARIESACLRVADECNLSAVDHVGTESRGDDPAASPERNALGRGHIELSGRRGSGDGGNDLAAASERRIKAAPARVPGEGKAALPFGYSSCACHDELAVGLLGDC